MAGRNKDEISQSWFEMQKQKKFLQEISHSLHPVFFTAEDGCPWLYLEVAMRAGLPNMVDPQNKRCEGLKGQVVCDSCRLKG